MALRKYGYQYYTLKEITFSHNHGTLENKL